MNRIRAANMALQFAIMPLAAFITFTTVWAQGRTLLIPSVFYALALLQLPQVSIPQIPFRCRSHQRTTFTAVWARRRTLPIPSCLTRSPCSGCRR